MTTFHTDSKGVERYVENRIVSYLLLSGNTDMKGIWRMALDGKFSRSEMKQFYKLIGTSKSGFGDIDFSIFKK